MIELDGVARRMLLCPPDLNPDTSRRADRRRRDRCRRHRRARSLGRDRRAAGRDRTTAASGRRAGQDRARDGMADADVGHVGRAENRRPYAGSADRRDRRRRPARSGPAPVWATFYDIRRYGGLQIFLRAVLGGGSMVLSEPARGARRSRRAAERARRHAHLRHAVALAQASDERLGRAASRRATSACPARSPTRPCSTACSAAFPNASVGHAYASTEAGVGFAVNDGLRRLSGRLISATATASR